MDPSQIDALVHRLVANPHDQDALASAHHAGVSDPKSYALLLERVGAETRDPVYASHWLSEAANVWSTTIGDAHRAARVLMQAIDRDPTQRTAAERLAQLYRDKGDAKALVALLERRAKALSPLAAQSAQQREELAGMHEELGRLWNESLQQPKKALENFRRAMDLDPSSAYPIYGAREIYKALGQWEDAYQMYDAEIAIERDPQRKLALYRDEASTRRAANDLEGASRALGNALEVSGRDPGLQQEYSSVVLERIAGGENVPEKERSKAAELLIGLAEAYDGEHGLAYSAGALDIEPGHDRALQLYAHYANALGRDEDLSSRYLAYVQANPSGSMAEDARWLLAASYEGAGQIEPAIELLEPLRARGDDKAEAKLTELYSRAGRPVPATPPTGAAKRAERQASAPRSGAGTLESLLAAAEEAAAKGDSAKAYAHYREVLASDAAHPEALSWVEEHLRTKRDYAGLRDVLLLAVRSPGQTVDARRDRLREVAGLCESNLRDTDGAIAAYRQLLALDRTDDSARQALARLLEKAHRWDDLANLLEQEAAAEPDIEKKISLEKKLAALHEGKRKDPASAAEAWARIANVAPEDDDAVLTAAAMFEQAGLLERASQVVADNASSLSEASARAPILRRLGALRELLHDMAGAGQAYAEAAGATESTTAWESAERCFVAAEQWESAGRAAFARAEMERGSPQDKAKHYARAAEHCRRADDAMSALAYLERAAGLDPGNEDYVQQLADRYTAAARWADLAAVLARHAEHLDDRAARVGVRKRLARLYSTELGDKDGGREVWSRILQDGEDKEALQRLLDDAVERTDPADATALLRRLEALATDPAERVELALREAEMLADEVGDVSTAIAHYERILAELDPRCRPALQAIADLEQAAENLPAATSALERELTLVEDPGQRVPIATRLAGLYEQLGDTKQAIAALEAVRKADPEDFDALHRLSELCERDGDWPRVAELLAQRIEVEADEAEVSILTKRLSRILADKLDRGDEALAVLAELAEQGDPSVRAAYVELGDRLGWAGIVGEKIVGWWLTAKPSDERTKQLRGAFDRFLQVGRTAEAVSLAAELARAKGGADRELATQLEGLATKSRDLDALAIAHDLRVRDLAGRERAEELVRQAEVRVAAGAPKLEALQHGEAGLASVSPAESEPLLVRLGALAPEPGEVVGLYERQVSRCKNPGDRLHALARAARVASEHQLYERAGQFFELALAGAPSEETLALLEATARAGDEDSGMDGLRRALAAAMAAGGRGARDGGRTRGFLLRRAASLVSSELNDIDQAFVWLGDALVAHVEPATLDAVEELAKWIGDPQRAVATLGRALSEVFDGPLVRLLLARRAKIRREQLDDRQGAAADLMKLHELSPSEQSVNDELSALLKELGDHRGMVQLFEDQILRGKDLNARVDLARRVARMWEDELADPREAADAWRRVLRMRQGDPEATAGLERSKAKMLKRSEGAGENKAPPLVAATPLPQAPPSPSPASVREPAAESEAFPVEFSAMANPLDAVEDAAPVRAIPTQAGAPALDLPQHEERPALRASDSGEPTPPYGVPSAPITMGLEAEEEVLMADDLAEVVEVEEPSVVVEAAQEKSKRSFPPPVPRG